MVIFFVNGIEAIVNWKSTDGEIDFFLPCLDWSKLALAEHAVDGEQCTLDSGRSLQKINLKQILLFSFGLKQTQMCILLHRNKKKRPPLDLLP